MTQILSWGRTELRADSVAATLAEGPHGWTVSVRVDGLDAMGLPDHATVAAILRHPSHVSLPRVELGCLADAAEGALEGSLLLGESSRPEGFAVNLLVTDPLTHEILGRRFGVAPVVERPADGEAARPRRSFVSVIEEPSLDVPLRVECRPSGPAIAWCRAPRGRALVFDGVAHLREPVNRAVLLPVAFEIWTAHLLSADDEPTGPGWDALRGMVARLFGVGSWREAREIGREDPGEKAASAAALLYRSTLADSLERAVRAAAEGTDDTTGEEAA